ncbi:MAG: DNA-3-methyladenine glycosylase [Candidatus Saccharibacteria bacterium]|nr:DNA-3-methyladenine glycosylase [Candidatus Saccharibacteria bacterium]
MNLETLLAGPAEEVAPRLLGSHLVREVDGQTLIGRIVETEAYSQQDAASHSYRGETERTKIMFGPAGFLYVYFTYGMHYCCNVVVGGAGEGAAALIRAVEPIQGEDIMRHNRHGIAGVQITNGPAKLCQALHIDRTQNGHDLSKSPLKLVMQPALTQTHIVQTTRIGITKAADVPWRFYERDNPYISKL